MAGFSSGNKPTGIIDETSSQTMSNKTIDSSNLIDNAALPSSLVGKSIETPSRADVKQDTLANLETYAGSASNGQFVFATDTKQMFQIVDSALAAVGSGGGGLDIFLSHTFENEASSTITTGNASAPDAAGTGTLDGAVADETSAPISGDTSIKYTMGSSSADDFFMNDTDIEIDLKQAGNTVGINLYYSYNGDDGDIKLIILDQDDVVLSDSLDSLEAVSDPKRFSTSVNIPLGTTGLRYGFQIVTGNSGKVLTYDDVEISTNPFVAVELLENKHSLLFTDWSGRGTSNTTVGSFDEMRVNNDVANAVDPSNSTIVTGPFEVIDSDAAGLSIKILKTGFYNLRATAYFDDNGAATSCALSVNSVQLTTDPDSLDRDVKVDGNLFSGSTQNRTQGLGYHGQLQKDDIVRLQVSTNSLGDGNGTGRSWFSISYEGDMTEHIVTPAKSGVENYVVKSDSAITNTLNELASVTGTGISSTITLLKDCMIISSLYSRISINNNGQSVHIAVDAVNVASGVASADGTKTYGTGASYHDKLPKGSVITFSRGANMSNTDISVMLVQSDVTFLAAVPVQRVCYIKDVKSNGTHGGTATSGSYLTRDLNTVEGDTALVSLSTNQFTLQAGTYDIYASAPFKDSSYSKIRIYNITDASIAIAGTNNYNGGTNLSNLTGGITITSAKVFEVQYRVVTTRATDGLGAGASFTEDEVFTAVKITKLK